MKKIVLLCAAGMSTSALVNKMKAYAEKSGYEYDISAHPIAEATTYGADADCVLLGPQVRFNLAEVKGKLPGKPVEAIDMRAYGMMDGAKVVETARKMMGEA